MMAFLESRVQQLFRDGVWVVMYRCPGKSQRTPEEIEVVKGRATSLAEEMDTPFLRLHSRLGRCGCRFRYHLEGDRSPSKDVKISKVMFWDAGTGGARL